MLQQQPDKKSCSASRYQWPDECQQPEQVSEEAVAYVQTRKSPCCFTVKEMEAILAQAETQEDIDSETIHAYFKAKYPFIYPARLTDQL